jgi:DNA-binding GntR family transcriptional regulator
VSNRGPIVRSGLADQVYEALAGRILDMEYAAGDRLVIDQLARELGVSVTPVRDALTRLAAERLIDFAPFRGYTVLPTPTAEDIRQSFEAREGIEAFAVRLGCKKATDAQLDRLEELHERLAAGRYEGRSGSFAGFVRLNQQFHEEIVATSGNRTLVEARRQLYHDVLVARTLHGRGVTDLEQIDAEHRAILASFRRRDCRALETAVVRHIREGASRVLASHGRD